ncbi:DUF3372 domain-containing protein [Psychrosphaera ytuae]|uniref:pullulanase n=1 Tax=Psychrosphaera ytuae TaxID=2820710 RepID=A0A975HHY7_9GAMM|nr:alpha-1,6-glucosidase domain-containing protein [Psychrosphaera ytuae]QTH63660.1 DUF3372 domain-containing protein [Psychrosphaera ytuae]
MLDKSWLSKSLLASSVALALTACGGGGGDDTPPTQGLNCTAPQVPNDAGTACVTPPVQQENQAPEISSASSFDVEEGKANGTQVYFAQASDPENDSLTWSLSDPAGRFEIDAASGVITIKDTSKVAVALGSSDMTLTVTDDGTPSKSDSITLSVEVNEAELYIPAPAVIPEDDEGVVYYLREDGVYDGYVLHAWNNEECDAYADFASGAGTEWTAGLEPTGIDPNYGAFWHFDTKANATCANFIVHKGDQKDPDSDQKVALENNRWSFVVSGKGVFSEPEEVFAEQPISIEGASAHWVGKNTLLWNGDATNIALIWSLDGDLAESLTLTNRIELSAGTLDSKLAEKVPHLANWKVFQFETNAELQRNLVKSQLVLVELDESDEPVAATYVQTQKALDDIFTSGANDADEVTDLGISYDSQGNITTKVWAPTAQSVSLLIYDANKALIANHPMVEDQTTGVWSYTTTEGQDYDRLYYRYRPKVYHPVSERIEFPEATDPYSVNTSTNGRYSQFVNMTDEDLYPAGWVGHTVPTVDYIEQGVFLEAHIRDFSIRDETTLEANRGKYKAFTETSSNAAQYLSEMAEAGVTHFHMLPANDIATNNEDEATRIDIDNTVGELCAVNSQAPVCGVEDDSATLLSVLEKYDPASNQARDLVNSFKGLDGFNWGYDPHHFNVVEGSYASNPEGTARILEFREMVQALHEKGMRVILDVVYNHTSSSGLYDNSVFDKLVPGYYHRYSEVTGEMERSTCCENTATENRMMGKFVVDSLVFWAKHYGLDGFRFDVMGHMPKDVILDGRTEVAKIDPDTYFYGEGWNWGEVVDNRLFEQATQYNLAGSEVGTFNDRPRDTIRNQALSLSTPDLTGADHIRLGLAGTLQNYVLMDKDGIEKEGSKFSQSSYALDPADIINYVSKHDNETLYDFLQYNFASSVTAETRARIHNLSSAIPLLSQGLPFFQLGVDKMRSKSMDRNTYDAGDWFNHVDYTNQTNNWNVGYPIERDGRYTTALSDEVNAQVAMTDIQLSSAVFKEFLKIRSSSPLFSLKTEADVKARVGFHNTGPDQTPGLIVMSIDDGIAVNDIDSAFDAIVVVINGTNEAKSHSVKTASGFTLHPIQAMSADTVVQNASFAESATEGTFTVPAHTIAVFVQQQAGDQGNGLGPDVDRVISPYGDTVIGLEGLTVGQFDKFEYDNRGNYTGSVVLEAGTYEFNLGDSTLTEVDLGFADVTIGSESIVITEGSTNSFAITVSQAASYKVNLNVESATPELSIVFGNSLVSCEMQDSTEPQPFNVAGDGYLYVKGDHSGWNAEADYKMTYKGDNQYQAVAQFDGAMQFKLASSDANWQTQLWAADSSGNIVQTPLAIGTEYTVAYKNAGTDNNSTTLAAGTYSFLLTLNEANPNQGDAVGSLIIQQCN